MHQKGLWFSGLNNGPCNSRISIINHAFWHMKQTWLSCLSPYLWTFKKLEFHLFFLTIYSVGKIERKIWDVWYVHGFISTDIHILKRKQILKGFICKIAWINLSHKKENRTVEREAYGMFHKTANSGYSLLKENFVERKFRWNKASGWGIWEIFV